MEINKKLDTDNDIEFLESGDLAHASNIVTNNTNEGILSEPAIETYISLLNPDENIVGYVACSDEFVIFTNFNRIFRCKENNNERLEISTNWSWEGGNVIGTYTYNINKELIISITELNVDKDVPLKIINLDKPDYIVGQSDNKYSINPEIPKYNLVNYSIITGNNMYKGVYTIFIRFKKGNEYTSWYKLGYPIIVHDKSYEFIAENYYYNKISDIGGYMPYNYTIKDTVNNDVEKVNKNIFIALNIKDDTYLYSYYQIGYAVNTTKNEIKVYSTYDYNINTKNITINGVNVKEDISFDDLTSIYFNVYNVKTLCNYNNRLYIANYKEENPNKLIQDIDVSDIIVKAVKPNNEEKPINANYNINNNPIVLDNKNIDFNVPEDINLDLKYVIKLRFKLKYNGTETEEFTGWFYIDNTYSYQTGKIAALLDSLTVLQTGFYTASKPISGRPTINEGYDDFRYCYIIKENDKFVVKFGELSTPSSSYLYDTFRYSFYYDENNKYTNIEYNSDDFIIEEIYQVNVTDNTIKPWWFLQPTIDFTEKELYPSFGGNLKIWVLQDYTDKYGGVNKGILNGVQNLYKSTGNGSVDGYYLRYDLHECDIYLYYTNFILDTYLELKYPNSTRKYKYKYNTVSEYPEFTNDHPAIDLDSYKTAYSVRAVYNEVTKKFMLCANGANRSSWTTYKEGYSYVQDDVEITTESGEKIIFNVSELDNILKVDAPNINKDINDFTGNYEITYEWKEDREPNISDFSPNLKYGITYFQRNNPTKNISIDVIPTTIGFRNRVTEGNIIKVDKDFVIMIPFKDWYNNNHSSKCTGTERYYLTKGSYTGEDIDEGIVSQLYIGFIKDITRKINNIDVYSAVLLKVADINNLKDVKALLPYSDVRYNIRVYDLVGAKPPWVDVEFPAYYAPIDNVYDNNKNSDNTNYNADIVKYAINNAVYNLFIHYVYPNGNYTDGIQLINNATYNTTIILGKANYDGTTIELTYDVDEDTKIYEIKRRYDEYLSKYKTIDTTTSHEVIKIFNDVSDVRFCNIFPIYNNNNIALYKNNNGDRLFRGSLNGNDINRMYNHAIKFVFSNIPMKKDFIGYFISYEKSEPILVAEGLLSAFGTSLNLNADYGEINSNELTLYYPEFDLVKKASGNILYYEKNSKFDVSYDDMFKDCYFSKDLDNYLSTGNNKNVISSIANVSIFAPNDLSNNKGRQGRIKITTKEDITHTRKGDKWGRSLPYGLLFNINDDIYLKKDKELISLSFIKYVDYKDGEIYEYGYENYNYNYDYYKVSNVIYDLNRWGVHYDEVNPSAKDNQGIYYSPEFPTDDHNHSSFVGVPTTAVKINTFSLYPTFAKNIKSKPVSKYYNFNSSTNGAGYVFTELVTHLYSDMINDIYELKSCFYDYADKTIVNLNKDNYNNFIEQYNNTIRRSDVISNESIENKWKRFRPEQYKIISENKGNIINIVGVGGYLIAHCEHSMFIFNRDSSMKTEDKNVQLIIPDAFDIDYVEMFTSTKGYAGIQKVNQFVCSNYGYIFYDSDAHKIYRFDENNLDEITPGFKNLFKHEIVDLNLTIDTYNERMICIGTVNIDNDIKRFAISYSFNNKYWISTHTYWYNDCFNTKNNTYFINNEKELSSIDTFVDNKYNIYTNIIDKDNIFNTELNKEDNPCSYIDVVFNNNNVDKVLNYISYAVNKATDDNYSGFKMLIYTNCCYTDYMDISVPKRSMRDYKHPYYRYGQWIFNWFRNKVANIDTKNPIIRGNGKLHPDTKFVAIKSLNDALVVGKYFVVRFVFYSDDKRISVNNIQCY